MKKICHVIDRCSDGCQNQILLLLLRVLLLLLLLLVLLLLFGDCPGLTLLHTLFITFHLYCCAERPAFECERLFESG